MLHKVSFEAKADETDERHYHKILENLEKKFLMLQKETDGRLRAMATTMEEAWLKMHPDIVTSIQATLRDQANKPETLEGKLLKAQKATEEQVRMIKAMMLGERFDLKPTAITDLQNTLHGYADRLGIVEEKFLHLSASGSDLQEAMKMLHKQANMVEDVIKNSVTHEKDVEQRLKDIEREAHEMLTMITQLQQKEDANIETACIKGATTRREGRGRPRSGR
eukprot:TRINITY_DN28783_c0_g1_i1.p1 TRINITY_DN28783_c0_g1~~TRINITY_DN28783_c0_g1_i1.p1  ORF type:complete len:222 (+),score=64.33 TRINITY_DN28783_c0_g1_i1:380-1045(+)